MRRNKEDLAAQLREEQCKERAERIRKEREEKAMRVRVFNQRHLFTISSSHQKCLMVNVWSTKV